MICCKELSVTNIRRFSRKDFCVIACPFGARNDKKAIFFEDEKKFIATLAKYQKVKYNKQKSNGQEGDEKLYAAGVLCVCGHL